MKNKKSRFETSNDDKLTTTNPTPQQRQFVISTESEREEPKEDPAESEAQIRALLNENFIENNDNSEDFKPFSKDPTKQKRYEQYLVCIKNGRKDALPILQPKSMTEWERDRERVEFERAFMLFKPLNFR